MGEPSCGCNVLVCIHRVQCLISLLCFHQCVVGFFFFSFLLRVGWKAEDSCWPPPLLFIVLFFVCITQNCVFVIETLCGINVLYF